MAKANDKLCGEPCVSEAGTQADDAEVGGIRGREARERVRNVVGRVESTSRRISWRSFRGNRAAPRPLVRLAAFVTPERDRDFFRCAVRVS